MSNWRSQLKRYFLIEEGGKRLIALTRVGAWSAGIVLILVAITAWFSGVEDRTFYLQSSSIARSDSEEDAPGGSAASKETRGLFNFGSKQLEEELKRKTVRQGRSVSIKYFAPQIVGRSGKSPQAIQTGAKLLGFLLTSIDTREPSLVSVHLPRGGTSDSGTEIPKDSVLMGSFSYRGTGNKVALSFTRLDTPDGDRFTIAAVGLDAADYTAGVRGKIFSDDNLKVAATLGLTMASSMADVLTERESLGNSFGPTEARPTMKNALLQGISHSAQDQAGRVSEQINSTQDYVLVPKGKEVIIQLTEDLKL